MAHEQSSTNAADPAQKLFSEYHTEIKRRKNVLDAPLEHKLFSSVPGMGSRDFIVPDQHFVLYSLSQTGFAPRRQGHAAIRIYGTFETSFDARHHAQIVTSIEPGTSMLISTTHEWCLAAETPERLRDEGADVLATKLSIHRGRTDADRAAFHDKAQRLRQSSGPSEATESDDDETPSSDHCKAALPSTECYRGANRRLPMHAQVVGQKVAAISCVTDDTEELAFRVYACFDTFEEADAWTRNVASKRVVDEHIDLVSTCQWLVPRRMTGINAPREAYRHPELNQIMTYMKDEPARVQEYKDWRREQALTDDNVEDTAVLLAD